MGISIVLNTEDELRFRVMLIDVPSERVAHDPTNILWRCVGSCWQNPSSRQLRYIDPYGYAIFNRLQMPAFLEEWQAVSKNALSEDMGLLNAIESLAKRCRDEDGFYLRFIGD